MNEIDWDKVPAWANHVVEDKVDVGRGYAWISHLENGGLIQWFFCDSRGEIDAPMELQIIATRPEQVEWNGKGLPPAGMICEGYVQDSSRVFKWHKVEVLKQVGGECAVLAVGSTYLRWCDKLRPIRTEEERAVEEMKNIVGDIDQVETWTDALKMLYKAGYRKTEDSCQDTKQD